MPTDALLTLGMLKLTSLILGSGGVLDEGGGGGLATKRGSSEAAMAVGAEKDIISSQVPSQAPFRDGLVVNGESLKVNASRLMH